MEWPLPRSDDVFAIIEGRCRRIFAKYGIYKIASSAHQKPAASRTRTRWRPTARQAGSAHRPDLQNISDLCTESEFEPFEARPKAIVPIDELPSDAETDRKALTDCEVQAGVKGYWFKMDENGRACRRRREVRAGPQEEAGADAGTR